jgi:putative transposase
MRKRRSADDVARLLREADRDLAKGLTVADICRKVGIAQTTYHRWRQRHDPARVDTDRRCRELEVELKRLKLLVAELMLDKQMLQDLAKKSGDPRPAAGGGGLPDRALRDLATAGLPRHGTVSVELAILPAAGQRRAGPDPRDQTVGAAISSVRLPANPCEVGPRGLVG